jgi:hypothetical protein
MKQDFTISVHKSFFHQDDVTHHLSYYIEPETLPKVLLGWEDAGYEIVNVCKQPERETYVN